MFSAAQLSLMPMVKPIEPMARLDPMHQIGHRAIGVVARRHGKGGSRDERKSKHHYDRRIEHGDLHALPNSGNLNPINAIVGGPGAIANVRRRTGHRCDNRDPHPTKTPKELP